MFVPEQQQAIRVTTPLASLIIIMQYNVAVVL